MRQFFLSEVKRKQNLFSPLFYTNKAVNPRVGTNQTRRSWWIDNFGLSERLWKSDVGQRLTLSLTPSLSHSRSTLRCELTRNRAQLQSLIKASSGNRPRSGHSFLLFTSRYFVFLQHHLFLSSVLIPVVGFVSCFSPSSSSVCWSLPSRSVSICHLLCSPEDTSDVKLRENPGGSLKDRTAH